jgi:hypothetical protein
MLKKGLQKLMKKKMMRLRVRITLTRDSIQPLGRIVSEEEQESLNSIGVSRREDVKHKREIASQLKQPKSIHR